MVNANHRVSVSLLAPHVNLSRAKTHWVFHRSWNDKEYPYNKDCNQKIMLIIFDCVNGNNVLAMQTPYISILFILATRRGFTLMAMSTLKIIPFGVQKTPMNS